MNEEKEKLKKQIKGIEEVIETDKIIKKNYQDKVKELAIEIKDMRILKMRMEGKLRRLKKAF